LIATAMVSMTGEMNASNAPGDCPDIKGIMLKRYVWSGILPAGESRMEWVLRLVETGIDGQSRSSDVMAISRPDDLGDLANLAACRT
jgi:hypothetical protein